MKTEFMPESRNTDPLVIARYLKGGGTDTVIGFKEPVRISYKTANLLPFDKILDVTSKKTGKKREVGGFQLADEYEVSVAAKILVASTIRTNYAGYVSYVIRAEKFDESCLTAKPDWNIEEFQYRESPEIEGALKNHCTLVQSLLSLRQNHPQVLYEGDHLFPNVSRL